MVIKKSPNKILIRTNHQPKEVAQALAAKAKALPFVQGASVFTSPGCNYTVSIYADHDFTPEEIERIEKL